MPQGSPGHQRQEQWRQVAERPDGAGDTDENGMTNHTRQSPPGCSAHDDRTAQQEKANSVAAQCRVDILHRRSNTPHGAAYAVGKGAQERGKAESELIEDGTALST